MGKSALWARGHRRDRFDDKPKGTQVLCNLRSYWRCDGSAIENRAFDPGLVVES